MVTLRQLNLVVFILKWQKFNNFVASPKKFDTLSTATVVVASDRHTVRAR